MKSISIIAALASALFFWMAPENLHAETIAVRSGENEGFTRIVLDLPNPRFWTLELDAKTARLVLNGAKVRFDLSNAFRKIGTDRVSGLQETKEDNTLAIGLNCDCKIEAFRLGARMLVIDVKGNSADATPLVETTDAPPATEAARASARAVKQSAINQIFPFGALSQARRTPLEFSPLANVEAGGATSAGTKSAALPLKENAFLASAGKLEREKRVSEAERRLAEQLGRAVSQGLITPRAARLPNLKPLTPAETEVTRKTDERSASERTPKTPGLNLRAETSADRDFQEVSDTIATTNNGETCLSPTQLDISAWGGDGTFSQQVGAHRGALVGEFDRPNRDATHQLAQLYIHYGFGAEALLVLKASGIADGDLALLQSMGDVMEYGHARAPAVFSNQFDCETPAALWAVLAHETIPSAAEINAGALLRAVNGLPPHLRNLLGPLASNRLRLVRQDDLAGQVLRLVERGNQTSDARFEMAQAGQQLADGDVTSASDSLSNVIESNTDLSPKALIKLVDSRLSANLPIDTATAELAGAYALEYRKQPLGGELKRVHILALSEADAYDKVFAELSLFANHASPETIARIRTHTMSAMAQNGDDQVFLKHALKVEDLALPTLSAATANSVASRLITLGFSANADRYLRPGADGAAGTKRRILRARAALAQMKPRRALAALLGLSGPEADMLRAQAHSMGGDHQAAQRLFATLEQTDRMIEEAWLAGDWNTLRNSGDALWTGVSYMAAPTADSEPPASGLQTGVLARNRALLMESATARETITALLARYPLENALPSAE